MSSRTRAAGRLIAMLALLVSAFAFSTGIASADYHACDTNPFAKGEFEGNNITSGTGTVFGARAFINDITSTHRPCTYSAGQDGTFSWPAIVPAYGSEHFNDPNAILQIGIAHCNGDAWVSNNPMCDPGTQTLFWAAGGCGHPPTGQYIMDTNSDNHSYVITRERSMPIGYYYWNLWSDNVIRAQILETDPRISCWITGDRMAQIATETWDPGDGIANADNKVDFTYVAIQTTLGGTFQAPGWSASSSCTMSTNTKFLDLKCDRTGGDKFQTWSVLLP